MNEVAVTHDPGALRRARFAKAGRRKIPGLAPSALGLVAIAAVIGVIVLAANLFLGNLQTTVPITVVSGRAGLVMNPQARVTMRGVQVGDVQSIETQPNGTAVLHLAMNPQQLRYIPENVTVDIQSTTAFGAKFVQLSSPPDPSPHTLQPGQILQSRHVTVEFNSIFEQLTDLLGKIEPAKLNETLGSLSTALNGRGDTLGSALDDFDQFLAKVQPSLPTLEQDLQLAPQVLNAYADAAPDLVKIFDNTAHISDTLVDQEAPLDNFLVNTIGLADIGNDVLGTNRQPLADSLHVLVPTTELLSQYHQALNCGLAGLAEQSKSPPSDVPGIVAASGLMLGIERYRYPQDLPKVAAKGGPFCLSLPKVPVGERPPFIVTDVGTNPWKYGNQGILLNSDALKQFLFGPIDGPPRNTAQIGQPG